MAKASDDTSVHIEAARRLPMFQALVRVAKARQRNSLTKLQYDQLEAKFLMSRRPVTSPLFGWYYTSRELLRSALAIEGVHVRNERVPKLHRFRLSRQGMARLTEIEQKIARRL